MTAALDHLPQLSEVFSGEVPSYVYYDSVQQDLLDKADAIRSGDIYATPKETANIAQVALLLADVLPPSQAEMLVVAIAAATHDADAIRAAHNEIDILFEDHPDRCRQSHEIADLTILYTDEETSVDEAAIKAIYDESESRGVDLEEPLERLFAENRILHEKANMLNQKAKNIEASTVIDLPTGALSRKEII